MTPEILACLKDLVTRFTESDLSGLRLRWQFGHKLLPLRVGKKLPKAELARIEEETGLSRRDIQHHLKFAVRYPTEADCETAITQYPSWTRLVHLGLYKQTPKDPTEGNKQTGTPRRVKNVLKSLRGLKREDLSDAAKKTLAKEVERLLAPVEQPKAA